jgi:hypothetical protein
MERLTKLDTYGHPYTNEKINCRNLVSKDGVNYQFVEFGNGVRAYDGKPIDKLYAIENIEEELGIPLEVLFKALKDGIYCVRKEDERPYIYFYEKLKLVPYDDNYLLSVYDEDYEETFIRNLKDYGKTWALTSEELE